MLGPKYWHSVAQIGAQAADALQYAHQRRTLHRDIKPANLLVDLQGVVWISDFGLAKAMEHDDLSQTGDIVGTLRYMAPERFHGQADARSDIYSLGLTLYELLTLRPAYDHSSPSVLMRKIGAEPPRPPPSAQPGDSPGPGNHRPEGRCPGAGASLRSAEELADDLQRFLDDRPIRARRVGLAERLWRWSRRNRAVAALTGLAVALLILVAVVASVGYVRTRIANRQVHEALDREARERQIAEGQREKAEALSELTLAALDDIFEQYVPNRVAGDGGFDARRPRRLRGPSSDPTRAVERGRRAAGTHAGVLRSPGAAERRRRRACGGKWPTPTAAWAISIAGLGHFEQAQAAYLKAIEGYQQLQREAAGNPAVAKEIARIYNELGDLHWAARWEGDGRSFHATGDGDLAGCAGRGSGVAGVSL